MIPDGGLFILRVPHERKKENKKQEDLPEDQPLPDGQMLQKGEGAQIFKDKAKDTGGDKATKEGPSLGRTEPRKDAKGKASPGLQTNPIPVHLQAPLGLLNGVLELELLTQGQSCWGRKSTVVANSKSAELLLFMTELLAPKL